MLIIAVREKIITAKASVIYMTLDIEKLQSLCAVIPRLAMICLRNDTSMQRDHYIVKIHS